MLARRGLGSAGMLERGELLAALEAHGGGSASACSLCLEGEGKGGGGSGGGGKQLLATGVCQTGDIL